MQEQSDKRNLPNHIAIIMDGNGRWAKGKGASRIFGHRNAIRAVRESAEFCAENGVSYLTLYAFSTENWARPKYEVDGLMTLLISTIGTEMSTLNDNNIKLRSIGDSSRLPQDAQNSLNSAIQETASNTGMTLILALNYSGRWDLENAMRLMLEDQEKGILSSKDLNQDLIGNYLSTKGIPDPELMIRTSGEMRISNFLLWQLAYAELYFTDLLWPDFRREHLAKALEVYTKRERRFGKTSEQIAV